MTAQIVTLPGTLTFFILNPKSFHLPEVFHQFPCHICYLSELVGPISPCVPAPGGSGVTQGGWDQLWTRRPALYPH